ncbi:hypothetical protein A6U85_03765 [Agrobacterium sp. 13-626]|nr:hypothetical protein A6U85_03765 [Agrobacterium sp. 13-626]
MAPPRKSRAQAEVDGTAATRPGRYRARNEPSITSPIGDPPDYIKDTPESKARSAWYEYAVELPWLRASNRSILVVASLLKGEILAGHMPTAQKLNLLRQTLGSLGATPADASKITVPDEDNDTDDAFFND